MISHQCNLKISINYLTNKNPQQIHLLRIFFNNYNLIRSISFCLSTLLCLCQKGSRLLLQRFYQFLKGFEH